MFRHMFLFLTLIWGIKCIVDTKDYRVAVVEYQRYYKSSQNFDNYRNVIKNLEPVDFIIFPEATLSTEAAIEVPNTDLTNCSTTENTLESIACLAREKSTYIIVNVYERINCNSNEEGCSNKGFNTYNTDLVYGRNGSLIAKYRKWNLYGEVGVNKTETPELVTFDTDKGTFGVFTCFDIQFPSPALNLTKNGIKNFIFPNMWFSELPFLTSLQVQQMWAQENDVTLLSSGANSMYVASGGSSIILGNREVLNMTIDPNLNSTNPATVLVSLVPAHSSNDRVSFKDSTDTIDAMGKALDKMVLNPDNFKEYSSELVGRISGTTTREVCHSSLCCKFNINQTIQQDSTNSYVYRLVAYTGVRSFSGLYNGGIEVCGLVACTNATDIMSCTERFPDYDSISWSVTFNNISITANFKKSDSRIQFPNSLLSSLRPLPPTETKWQKLESGDNVQREFSLLVPQTRLLTFAIYGRNFEEDSEPSTNFVY
ncbi:vanin-like protein 1 [Aethina tumida]|uniref:vanin-like protein 1 n=1 Tax=Aethina tumida TaxID=116153 RepID=UPI0021490302|nr:vanin-like protein 1 [Aethina tumida]